MEIIEFTGDKSERLALLVSSFMDGGFSGSKLLALGNIMQAVQHAEMQEYVKCLVARLDGRAIGFIFYTEMSGRFVSRIHHLYTYKRSRGLGAASALVAKVVADNVHVGLSIENSRLVGFYSERGFPIWTPNISCGGISNKAAAKIMGLKVKDLQSAFTTDHAKQTEFMDFQVRPEYAKYLIETSNAIYSKITGNKP